MYRSVLGAGSHGGVGIGSGQELAPFFLSLHVSVYFYA